MIRRRSARRAADLTVCPSCGRDTVVPTEWTEQGGSSWWMRLRCGECQADREVVVPDAAAHRYDQRLDEGMHAIARALDRLDRERMAAEADAFTTALRLDLLDAGDFAR
jgi:hypothetical protein